MVEEGGVGEGRVGADLPVAAHAGVRGKHGRKDTVKQAKVLTLVHSHAVSAASWTRTPHTAEEAPPTWFHLHSSLSAYLRPMANPDPVSSSIVFIS